MQLNQTANSATSADQANTPKSTYFRLHRPWILYFDTSKDYIVIQFICSSTKRIDLYSEMVTAKFSWQMPKYCHCRSDTNLQIRFFAHSISLDSFLRNFFCSVYALIRRSTFIMFESHIHHQDSAPPFSSLYTIIYMLKFFNIFSSKSTSLARTSRDSRQVSHTVL